MTTLFDEVNRRNKEMKNRLPMKLDLPERESPEPMKPMKPMKPMLPTAPASAPPPILVPVETSDAM